MPSPEYLHAIASAASILWWNIFWDTWYHWKKLNSMAQEIVHHCDIDCMKKYIILKLLDSNQSFFTSVWCTQQFHKLQTSPHTKFKCEISLLNHDFDTCASCITRNKRTTYYNWFLTARPISSVSSWHIRKRLYMLGASSLLWTLKSLGRPLIQIAQAIKELSKVKTLAETWCTQSVDFYIHHFILGIVSKYIDLIKDSSIYE